MRTILEQLYSSTNVSKVINCFNVNFWMWASLPPWKTSEDSCSSTGHWVETLLQVCRSWIRSQDLGEYWRLCWYHEILCTIHIRRIGWRFRCLSSVWIVYAFYERHFLLLNQACCSNNLELLVYAMYKICPVFFAICR